MRKAAHFAADLLVPRGGAAEIGLRRIGGASCGWGAPGSAADSVGVASWLTDLRPPREANLRVVDILEEDEGDPDRFRGARRRARVKRRRAQARGQKTCDTRRRKPIVRWSRGPSEGDGSSSSSPAANTIQTSVWRSVARSITASPGGGADGVEAQLPGGFRGGRCPAQGRATANPLPLDSF